MAVGSNCTQRLIELTGIDATVDEFHGKLHQVLERMLKNVRSRFVMQLTSQCRPMPGAVRLVQHLSRHGVPIAVRAPPRLCR